MDFDTLVLKEASASVMAVDVQYKLADFNEKKKLRKHRDKAFNAYTLARLELLKDEIICTDTHVQEMKDIRQEVEQAGDTQLLIKGIFRLVSFLIVL